MYMSDMPFMLILCYFSKLFLVIVLHLNLSLFSVSLIHMAHKNLRLNLD